MEKIPLTSLLLSAVVSLSAGALRQYYFVNQNLNWTEAQKYCREKYTDLATITNTQDQNETELVIKRANPNPAAPSNRVWIGLWSDNSWIWSLSNLTFYKENGFQYWNWQSGKPHGDCVYITANKHWHDITCTSTKPFICYNASKGFVLVQEQKNWTEAQRYCRENHTDLASVRNDTENEEIKKNIPDNLPSPNDGAWIGLRRRWFWSDNSTSTFTNWENGEPDLDENKGDICASISIENKHQRQWTDEECKEKHPFVCYDNKMVLVTENLTWTEALRYCRDRDMDLVSVVSEDIQNRVKNVTASASSPRVWLGLRHSCVVGLWFWVNGQTLCYDQWASGYGTGEENCTMTVRSGAIQTSEQRWISLPEDETNNFICVKAV